MRTPSGKRLDNKSTPQEMTDSLFPAALGSSSAGSAGLARPTLMAEHDDLTSSSITGGDGDVDIPEDVSAAGKKWSAEEDSRLRDAVDVFGTADWKKVSEAVGNGRTTKSVRARWDKLRSGETEHTQVRTEWWCIAGGLRTEVVLQVSRRARGAWTAADDDTLRRLVETHGGPENAKWSMVRENDGVCSDGPDGVGRRSPRLWGVAMGSSAVTGGTTTWIRRSIIRIGRMRRMMCCSVARW
jgi:hypothetical protein